MADDSIIYDTSKLRVPNDYGTATCINCGVEITNPMFICFSCGVQFDQSEVAYIYERI